MPVAADRARLTLLSARLDQAARVTLVDALVVRVRSDRRFAPVLGRLMRGMLEG